MQPPFDMDQSCPPAPRQTLAVHWDQRWPIYLRLSDLGIRCWCGPYQPLQVEIPSPAVAVQIWSVIRQLSTSRQERVAWLRQCWQISAPV
jgi:hypothetical protein